MNNVLSLDYCDQYWPRMKLQYDFYPIFLRNSFFFLEAKGLRLNGGLSEIQSFVVGELENSRGFFLIKKYASKICIAKFTNNFE